MKQMFLFLFLFICMYWCYHVGAMQARRGCHIPWNWLRAALWVLETKSRPSRKAASPLNVLMDKIQNIIILDTISWAHQGKEFFGGGGEAFYWTASWESLSCHPDGKMASFFSCITSLKLVVSAIQRVYIVHFVTLFLWYEETLSLGKWSQNLGWFLGSCTKLIAP